MVPDILQVVYDLGFVIVSIHIELRDLNEQDKSWVSKENLNNSGEN